MGVEVRVLARKRVLPHSLLATGSMRQVLHGCACALRGQLAVWRAVKAVVRTYVGVDGHPAQTGLAQLPAVCTAMSQTIRCRQKKSGRSAGWVQRRPTAARVLGTHG